MMQIYIICSVFLCLIAVNAQQQKYHGILINGFSGDTQLYDPFNSPNAQGNLHLGLPTGRNAYFGVAVMSGSLAYFASGGLLSDIAVSVGLDRVENVESSRVESSRNVENFDTC